MVKKIIKKGTKLWINNKEMIASFEYPFLDELKREIAVYNYEISEDNAEKYLKNDISLNFILHDPSNAKKFLRLLKKEISELIEDYLFGSDEKENSFEKVRSGMFRMKEQLQLMSKIPLDINDFINIVFFCEFDMSSKVLK